MNLDWYLVVNAALACGYSDASDRGIRAVNFGGLPASNVVVLVVGGETGFRLMTDFVGCGC